ncbi:MAG: hypothetical protein NTV92_02025, partial [Candidatus Bipolaricaulota bacterium]|nr:hypothetical protein [Candidatus Bipolaricaulota bacterium]
TVSGGQDVAGNTQVPRTNTDYVDIDTRNPVGAATVNRTMVPGGSPVHEDALVLTVTVTYDEAMNTSTTPTIALQDAGTHWGGQTSLGWTGSTVYRATFTHDGTEEPSLPATAITAFARVTNGSGAKDLAGNADVGDDSPTFQIDTRKPRATVTVNRTLVSGGSPVYEGALVLTVTVTYDEAMNTGTMPTITLQNGGTHWGSQTTLGWTGSTVYRATFTHDGTEEPSLTATAITAFVRTTSGSGARDLAGNDDVGDDSPTFDIDTRKPRATVAVDRTTIAAGSPIYEGALAVTVTVAYDEAMNTATRPTITLPGGGTHWGAQTSLGWTGNTVYRATFTHDGTEEPMPPMPALTALARVLATSGA